MSAVTIKKIDENAFRFTFTDNSLVVLIRHGDLLEESCDAIVNSTNLTLCPNGGLDTQIHNTMGQFFTDQVVGIHKNMGDKSCPVGQSRIFIAKYNRVENGPFFIISTVGPVYNESEKDQARFLLQSCYDTSLALANIYQLTSIAYPAISCGESRFPPKEAAQVVIDAVRKFSCNIKDVRFVLSDRPLFDIFLQEWKDYANEINREIGNTETINDNTTEPSNNVEEPIQLCVSPEPSNPRCTLCDRQELLDPEAVLCRNCFELPREQVFKYFLDKLRNASEKSFNDLKKECLLLQKILTLYSLVYQPVQVFDTVRHVRDRVSEHYLKSYCDEMFSNYVSLAVSADGNCLYNSFIELKQPGTADNRSEITAIELRARNVIELVLNIDQYRSQYSNLLHLLDDYEKYIRDEMTKNSSYSSVWDLLSLPSVLNIELCCVYPDVNGSEDLHCKFLNKAVFIPLARNHTEANGNSRVQTRTVRNEIKIFFSHLDLPNVAIEKNGKGWVPNHFVPLIKLK